MLDYTLEGIFEDLSKEQKQIIERIKLSNDKDEIKKLDKQLDAISLFVSHLIKFRRSIN